MTPTDPSPAAAPTSSPDRAAPPLPPAGSARRGGLPYRDLIWTLVRTDFKARYHGTLSGFVWALLKPLTMFVALLAIFSFVFSTEPNYRINLLIGLFLWDFFSESTKVGLVSLAQKGFLLTKARFPGWIVVVASISNPLITLAVFAVAVTIYLSIRGDLAGAGGLAFFVLYLLLLIALVIGVSLASSVLYLRYRDLNQVWDLFAQAGFFITPIIWPIGAIPERFHFFLYLWPPTPFIEFSRQALAGGANPTSRATTYLLVETALVLGIGVLTFRRLSPRSAEYL